MTRITLICIIFSNFSLIAINFKVDFNYFVNFELNFLFNSFLKYRKFYYERAHDVPNFIMKGPMAHDRFQR